MTSKQLTPADRRDRQGQGIESQPDFATTHTGPQDRLFFSRCLPSAANLVALLEAKIVARAFLTGRAAEIDPEDLQCELFARMIRDARHRLGDGIEIARIIATPPHGTDGILCNHMREHIGQPVTQSEIELWSASVDYIRREGGNYHV